MCDLWPRVGFELRKILIFFFCAQPLGEPFGAFLNSFWGHFPTINCRVLRVLQLL
jgi:hypothetical protein